MSKDDTRSTQVLKDVDKMVVENKQTNKKKQFIN